jgi:hypothetical protein
MTLTRSLVTPVFSMLLALAAGSCGKSDTSKAGGEKQSSASSPSAPAPDAAAASDSLGALTFPLSEGTPAARAHFMRGLLALHSFWYDEATREFQAAIDTDPQMNMAYWGLAMSHCKLLWGEDDLGAAKLALSRSPDPDRLSEYELVWVAAALELLRAPDVRTARARFLSAMESIYSSYPDDESATFLALAMLSTIRPGDPDPDAVRKRAASLAGAVYARNPKHPGAAHYVIHALDTPELAAQALPHARAYASIAPAAFHAQHMPSHIFSRLGMWNEALASCQSAWDASLASAATHKLSANHHDFHSLNWLIEMSFEVGHRKDADAALARFADAVRKGLDHKLRSVYAVQVSSYMMRTGAWARVEELLAPLKAAAAEDPSAAPAAGSAMRVGEGSSHCAPGSPGSPAALFEQQATIAARARAAAMQRDLAKTKKYLGEADAVREKLRPFMTATQPKEAIPRLDAAHARHRAVLLAYAQGNDRALVTALRATLADAAQDANSESNPSGYLVHEEIAEILLRLDKPKDALAEYALALDQVPGRSRSLLGSARAAKRAGDEPAAVQWYKQLLAQWTSADDTMDGLAEARAAVAGK